MASSLAYGLLPEHLLLGLLLALMMLEAGQAPTRVGDVLLKLVLLAAGCVLVRQYAQGYAVELLPGEVRVDRFAVLAKLVILSCALVWSFVVVAERTLKTAMLLCSSLLGAFVMMDSAGFISLVLGIEMLSLPAFALMVHGAGATAASEGAFKYLLLSAVASALIMFGIAFSYGTTGTLEIDAFARIAAEGSAQGVAATVLIVSGFFCKAAVFPFHAWAPDAYGSVNVRVTAFLASIVKGAVILGLLRVLATVPLASATVTTVATLALISVLYGNSAAIKQTGFRRLLAYSSIAHAGYMMFAFVDSTGARVDDLLWYVLIYALSVNVACASFAALHQGEDDDVRALDGAFQSRPVVAVVFGLSMLTLAGLPPLPGFFAKLFVFRSAIASGYLGPAIVALVGSFIGATFYLALFYRLFNAPRSEERVA